VASVLTHTTLATNSQTYKKKRAALRIPHALMK
jgi:hypothetical protein